jgi:Phage protein Gp138 N-terminal domain
MDPRELTNDPSEMLRVALDARQTKTWTALPGYVTKYDPTKLTCEVQPTIMARRTSVNQKTHPPTYTTTLETFPLLLDCPVVFPQGGGAMLSFPIQPGDECLVVFGSRGIDHWWQSGGVQPPATARMHHLSDGFVIPGPFSQPRVPGNASPSKTDAGRPVSTDVVELRSLDGVYSLSFHPGSGAVNITGSLNVGQNVLAGNGASGQFTTPTGQTVTVQNGIITNIF